MYFKGGQLQGSKLTVANSKICHLKIPFATCNNVGSKKLLPGNFVMKVISWKNKLIFTEIILLFIGQNTISYGQRHYQCL